MSDTVDRIRESVRLATMHEPDGARVFLRTGDIRALLDRLDAAERENERLRSAINWACGYDEGEPHFGEQPERDAPYAWRHELRRRAGMPWKEIDAARAAEQSDERREG